MTQAMTTSCQFKYLKGVYLSIVYLSSANGRDCWCETFLAQMKCGHTISVKVRQFQISKIEGLYREVE